MNWEASVQLLALPSKLVALDRHSTLHQNLLFEQIYPILIKKRIILTLWFFRSGSLTF